MRARVASFALWTLVAIQVAIPASYYLWRSPTDDERFAWRMFSAVRLKRCTVQVFDDEGASDKRPLALAHAAHASWVRSMTRGRQRVIERFLATRCAGRRAAEPVLFRHCAWPSGRTLPSEAYRYDCAAGQLEVSR